MACILIIDDDDNMRKFIRRILERDGHVVFEAQNGAAGLNLLQTEEVDLIITDIFMPEQNGISTIMQLSSDYPHTKIIAISGGGNINSVDYLELAKNVGAHEILQKPFNGEQLSAAVNKVL